MHPSNHRPRRSYADSANPSVEGRGAHPDRRSRPNSKNNNMNRMPHRASAMDSRQNTIPQRGGEDFRSMGGGHSGGRGMERPNPHHPNWGESSTAGPQRGGGPPIKPVMRNTPLPAMGMRPSLPKRSRDAGSVSSEGEILSDSELTPPSVQQQHLMSSHRLSSHEERDRYPALPHSRGDDQRNDPIGAVVYAPPIRPNIPSHPIINGNSATYAALPEQLPLSRRGSDSVHSSVASHTDRSNRNIPSEPARGGTLHRPTDFHHSPGPVPDSRREGHSDSVGFRRAPLKGDHYGPSSTEAPMLRELEHPHHPPHQSHYRPSAMDISHSAAMSGSSFTSMVSRPPEAPSTSSYASLDAPRSSEGSGMTEHPQRRDPPDRRWPLTGRGPGNMERKGEDRGLIREPERWNDTHHREDFHQHPDGPVRRGDVGRGLPGVRGDTGRAMPGGRGDVGRGMPGGRGDGGRGLPGGRGDVGRGMTGGRGDGGRGMPGGRGDMGRGMPGGRGEEDRRMPGGRGDMGRGMPGGRSEEDRRMPGGRGDMGRGMPGGRGDAGRGMPRGLGDAGRGLPDGRGGRASRGGRGGKAGGRDGGGRGARRGRNAAADHSFPSQRSMGPSLTTRQFDAMEFRARRGDGPSMPQDYGPFSNHMASSIGELELHPPLLMETEKEFISCAVEPESTADVVLPTLPVTEPEEEIVEEMKFEEPPPRPISPPPPASEPSALVLATIRWADLETQMEYEYAKFCRLSEEQQRLRAEYQCLERLPVGISAFQEDYDAHVAATATLVDSDPTSGG